MDVPFDRNPLIETAEILRVDETLMVVDAITKTTGRRIQNMEVGGLALERDGGFMGGLPKVGDKCLVAFPSDDALPKMISMLPYADPRNAFRGNRKAMRQGDKAMTTGFGNYVHVHAGGVVDIASNPITRRMYVPVLNQIKDFCENYLLNSGGGRFRWDVRRDDKSAEGAQTEMVWEIKDFTDAGRVVEIRRGNVAGVTDMPDPVVDHKAVFAGSDEVYRCTVDKAGNILVVALGSTESYSGKKIISAEAGIVLTSEGIAAYDEDPGKTRGSIHVTTAGGVELAEATEPAVLGDTWKSIMEEYDSKISTLLSDINTASLSFAAAATSAVAPGAMAPVGAKYGADMAVAVNKAAGGLVGVVAKFAQFLAADTKLS